MPPYFARNLRTEQSVTVDASGRAVATVENVNRYTWEVKQISIAQAPTTGLEASAKTYVGRGPEGVFISQSYTGTTGDTDSEPNVLIRMGEALTCVWEGGTPGARATLTVVYNQVPD